MSTRLKVRCVSLDIDGTLVERGGEVPSEVVVASVNEFAKLGGAVVFNTGRPLDLTLKFARHFDLPGFDAIVNAGAETYRIVKGKPERTRDIAVGVYALERTLQALKNHDGLCGFDGNTSNLLATKSLVPRDMTSQRIRSIFSCFRSEDVPEVIEELAVVDRIHTATSMAWGGYHPDFTFMHTTADHGTKLKGLEEYLASKGFGWDDVLVMGDDNADMPVLRKAKCAAGIGMTVSHVMNNDGIMCFPGAEADGAVAAMSAMALG